MWVRNFATQAMQAMSQANEPGELIQVFATRVREVLQVDRVLLVSRRGLRQPQYQIIAAHLWSEGAGGFIESYSVELRSGGLLAEVLYAGQLQMMVACSPAAEDPAFDLLCGQRTLMAFPMHEDGAVAGMLILLSAAPTPCEASVLVALAMVTNVLQRTIQSHELARQVAISCEELDSALKAVADAQRWLLPAELPDCPGVSLAASYLPARRGGGDYYDAVTLPDGKLGLLIAEVSGNGVAAAVLVAVLRTFVRLERAVWSSPARLLSGLNVHLCGLDLLGHRGFVTAFCGVLDPKTGTLTYSSGGHTPPRLLSGCRAQVSGLKGARAVPLGLSPRARYTEESAALLPGDLLLLCTDGIVQAASPEKAFFGTERLDNVLLGLPSSCTSEEVIREVLQAINAFAGFQRASDDQTLLAVSFSGGTS